MTAQRFEAGEAGRMEDVVQRDPRAAGRADDPESAVRDEAVGVLLPAASGGAPASAANGGAQGALDGAPLATAQLEGAAAPFEDAAAPFEDAAAPFEDAAAPLDGAAASLEDAAAPLDGAAAPLDGAAAPLEDAAAPLEDAAAPLEDAAWPPAVIAAPSRRSYREVLAGLAQRVLEAQRPIRILQALRWDAQIEEQFVRAKRRELPAVSYAEDLGFDPYVKLRELEDILRDAEREFGVHDQLGQILCTTADEYRRVVLMLMGRGTKEFYRHSRELYGSPKDKLPDGTTSVRDMGAILYDLLATIGGERLGPAQQRDITAETAAIELNARFDRFFGGASIRVQVDDSLLADAAAGSDYVKLRSGAMFSRSDIDILEAHEGWVHVATSLNGQAQPVARWLAKGPPRTTAVQEGLAVLLEIFTFRSTPRRAKKLNDRILAVDKAEDGASFLDVFEWYRTEGYDEQECFQSARRVFRGGVIDGGAPFTKDACYCKGIVLNFAFMRAAIHHDRAALIPFLFAGKVAHEDVPVLYAHVADGIIKPPPYLPPVFDDINGLAIWICYSSFFSRLGGTAITEHYGRMLDR